MDIITYAICKKIAEGAVSGVASMSVSGQTLTINCTDGTVLTMVFPTPSDGVSVTDVKLDASKHLIVTLSDGSEIDAGLVPTAKGDKGDKGDDGLGIKSVAINAQNHLIITYDDDTTEDAGEIPAGTGAVSSVNGKTGTVVLDADDVGAVAKETGKGLSDNDYTDADKAIVDGVATALAGKVDKETGKSLIDLTTVVDGASYDSTNHLILFKHQSATLFSLDAAAFVKDGMVDTVAIVGANLVITFNTDAGKQDISIPLTDIFDPDNYYDKTATDTLLGAKADQTEVNSIENYYGSKNLCIYPFNQTTKTTNGITFTDNGDGTVTATGTATDNAIFNVSLRLENGKLILPNGEYKVNGCPSGGSTNSYLMVMSRTSGGASDNYGNDTGNGMTATLNGDDFSQDNVHFQIAIVIKSGYEITTPLVFKPMVRLASIKDDTYVPYVPTNAKLNEEKMSYADNGVLGAKNLLTYPYYNTTKTQNGVTFTDNGDGTVTVNGTATDGVVFFCSIRGENGKCILPNGTYIVTGCPSGGAANSYKIGASRITGGSGTTYGMDAGNGLTITLDGDDFGDDDVRLQIGIAISEGTVCNNLVFKPMVRLASDPDDTYQPYAMTNKELTKDMMYSTSEIDTGKKWIDGKPIYRKVIDIGTLPNTTTKSVDHGITNFDLCISLVGVVRNSTSRLTIPSVWNDATETIGIYANGTSVIVSTGKDRSSFSGYAIIEYTKSV